MQVCDACRRSSSSLALQQRNAELAGELSIAHKLPTLSETLSHLQWYHVIVGFSFCTSYCVFPALTSHICSTSNQSPHPPCRSPPEAGRLHGEATCSPQVLPARTHLVFTYKRKAGAFRAAGRWLIACQYGTQWCMVA